jgi:phage terminase small subunit
VNQVLTQKQLAFVNAYMELKNQTQAAIKVGFSKKGAGVAGTRMLKNANVKELIRLRQIEIDGTAVVTAAWVLEKLKRVADVCGRVDMVDGKEKVNDARGATHALELLGKHLKLFTDRIEITDADKLINLMAEARKSAGIS